MSIVYENSTDIVNSELTDIKIYPNPVTDKLNIISPNRLHFVEIYTFSGQLIFKVNGNMSQVDISKLSKGNYIVKLVSEAGVVSKLIMKE